MKKYLLFAAMAFMALTLVSCDEDDIPRNTGEDKETVIVYKVNFLEAEVKLEVDAEEVKKEKYQKAIAAAEEEIKSKMMPIGTTYSLIYTLNANAGKLLITYPNKTQTNAEYVISTDSEGKGIFVILYSGGERTTYEIRIDDRYQTTRFVQGFKSEYGTLEIEEDNVVRVLKAEGREVVSRLVN